MKAATRARKDAEKTKRVIKVKPKKRQPKGDGMYWVRGMGWYRGPTGSG